MAKTFAFIMGGLVVFLVVIAYVGRNPEFPKPPASEPQVQKEKPASERRVQKFKRDASGDLACWELLQLIDDLPKRFLTHSEIRDRIKKVREYSQYSESGRIQPAGDALLRAATIGTTVDLIEAMTSMADACTGQ